MAPPETRMGQPAVEAIVNEATTPTRNSHDAANQAHHHGLSKKLALHVALSCANGHADADFPRALTHGNQHDIHDSNSAHQQ